MKEPYASRARLSPGIAKTMPIAEPILDVVPGKGRAYLWIGNNAGYDKQCYATLSGPATLRALARAILAEVGDE